MSDGIDPVVDGMQEAGRCPAGDRALREAQLTQLRLADDPMLPARQLGDPSMSSHFLPHTGNKGELGGNSPPGNICSGR